MFRVVVLLALASVLLAALALISCLSVEDRRLIRGMPRAGWVAVILLVPLGGAIAWFLAGRPRPAGGTRVGRRAGGILPKPPHPRAPDDDPEFLRSLDERTVSGEDEQQRDEPRRDEQQRDEPRRDERRRDPGTDA